jgi:hypothetical protein
MESSEEEIMTIVELVCTSDSLFYLIKLMIAYRSRKVLVVRGWTILKG